MSVSEVAELLGVTYQRAGQIIDAYDDFPAPVVEVAGRRGWDRSEVVKWIKAHPKRPPGRPRQDENKTKKKGRR